VEREGRITNAPVSNTTVKDHCADSNAVYWTCPFLTMPRRPHSGLSQTARSSPPVRSRSCPSV
jgi:hypothetical protein